VKKSVMKKWVAALRSGKYKQGRGVLSQDGKYCCLGVLCEVLGAEKKVDSDGIVSYGVKGSKDRQTGVLPIAIQEACGMKSGYGVIAFGENYLSLATLNDRRKRSFKHIAAYIERNWEKL
jgi:hypothetical protein